MPFWMYQSAFPWTDTRGYLSDQSRLWLNALFKTVTTEGEGPVQLGGDIGGTSATPIVIGLQGRPVAATVPTNGQVLAWSSTNNDWEPKAAAVGTVTSVGLAAPPEFTVSGSPVTGSGTLTLAKASQTQNRVYASPSGASGVPTFRALAQADMPSGIAPQVNSDWNAASGVAQILNKPTIPAAQVNSDWTASSGLPQILNKPPLTYNGGTTTSTITGNLSVTSNVSVPGGLVVVQSPDATRSLQINCANGGAPNLTSNVTGQSAIVTLPAGTTNYLTISHPSAYMNLGVTNTIVNSAYHPYLASSTGAVTTNAQFLTTSTNGLCCFSADSSRNGAFYCINGGQPTLASTTGNINATASVSVINASGVLTYSPDQTRYAQLACSNGANPTIGSNTGTLTCNSALSCTSTLYVTNHVSAQAYDTHASGSGIADIQKNFKRKEAVVLQAASGDMPAQMKTPIPPNCWTLVPAEDGMHVLWKLDEDTVLEYVIPINKFKPI